LEQGVFVLCSLSFSFSWVSFKKMNLGESVKMNLNEFEWLFVCLFLMDLEIKVSGFGVNFVKVCE